MCINEEKRVSVAATRTIQESLHIVKAESVPGGYVDRPQLMDMISSDSLTSVNSLGGSSALSGMCPAPSSLVCQSKRADKNNDRTSFLAEKRGKVSAHVCHHDAREIAGPMGRKTL